MVARPDRGWREITDAVHAKGLFIWCQLWALGRASNPDLRKELGLQLLAPSPVAISADRPVPKEMSETEIQEMIEDHRTAARNVMETGFDGVEIQGSGGYLSDQFLQPVTNQRTDYWGGSIEHRARFPIELLKAVSGEIGSKRVAIRLSP
jgi:NADPH2 dehydrogenase